MKKTLFFIYNAEADKVNKSLDFLHKIVSPNTYTCSLCSITHGNFSEQKEWRQYREQTDHEFIFMYKNEFIKKYGDTWKTKAFPMVLSCDSEGIFQEVITAELLTQIKTIPALIAQVDSYLLK